MACGFVVVVVPRNGKERHELLREGQTGDGVEVLIRAAKVSPPSPSMDKQKDISWSLADLGLHAP